MKAKTTVCIRIQFYSLWIGLEHQYGRRFGFVLVHQRGRRDVVWKRSIPDEGLCSKRREVCYLLQAAGTAYCILIN